MSGFLRSDDRKPPDMTAEQALVHLRKWGFTGVKAGRTEFYRAHNSDSISVEVGGKVEPISERDFLHGYKSWNFHEIDTTDHAAAV